jgi:hypothetical protein
MRHIVLPFRFLGQGVKVHLAITGEETVAAITFDLYGDMCGPHLPVFLAIVENYHVNCIFISAVMQGCSGNFTPLPLC